VRNRDWLSLTLYIATVLLTQTEPPAAGIAQAGQQPFDPPTKCGSPAAISKSAVGFPEARAVGTDAEAWALFFSPLDANRRVAREQFSIAAMRSHLRELLDEAGWLP